MPSDLQECAQRADGTHVTPASTRSTPAVEAALLSIESLTRGLAEDLPFSVLLLTDRDGRVRHAAGARWAERGHDTEALPGRLLYELLPADMHDMVREHYAAAERGEVRRFALPYGPGYRATLLPLRAADGTVAGALALAWDETQELRVEREAREELGRRLAQQAAVARLGELALRRVPIGDLTVAACRAVVENLDAELACVLEPAGEDGTMRVDAEVGWPAGFAGSTLRLGAFAAGEARERYAAGPVVIDAHDLARPLAERGVVTGAARADRHPGLRPPACLPRTRDRSEPSAPRTSTS